MKLAIIAPHNLELALLGDCQFALAQEVNKDNENWYAGRREWDDHLVILDHGAFEHGHPIVTYEPYMEIAEKIHATEVIAPDVQWDPYGTLEASKHFAKWFRKEGYDEKYKLMSVVWSSGPGDFGHWFQKHKYQIEPDVYGIGKWLESQYANGTREQLIKGMIQNYDAKPEQLHALGCPYAYEVYRLRNLVRSMDTGLPVKAVLQPMPVHLDHDQYKRLHPVKLRKLDSTSDVYVARSNVKTLLRLAHSN